MTPELVWIDKGLNAIAVAAVLCILIYCFEFFYFKKRRADVGLGGATDARIVTDLDRLLAQPVGFRWKGKTHFIKPMSNAVFLNTLNELASLSNLFKDGRTNTKVVVQAYAKLFRNVCDTITEKDVGEMSQAQIMALFRLVNNCVTGEAQVEGEKKTQDESKASPSTPQDSSGKLAVSTASPPSML